MNKPADNEALSAETDAAATTGTGAALERILPALLWRVLLAMATAQMVRRPRTSTTDGDDTR